MGGTAAPQDLNLMRISTIWIVRATIELPVFTFSKDKIMTASRTFAGSNSIMFPFLNCAYIPEMLLSVFFGLFYLD